MKSITTLGLLMMLGVSLSLGAAQPYNPQSHYSSGAEVSYNNQVFRAKWWANPGQSPAAVATVAHAWQTPWALTNKTPAPVTPKPDKPKPVTPKPDKPKPTVKLKAPQYVAGTSYKGGDVVANYGPAVPL